MAPQGWPQPRSTHWGPCAAHIFMQESSPGRLCFHLCTEARETATLTGSPRAGVSHRSRGGMQMSCSGPSTVGAQLSE